MDRTEAQSLLGNRVKAWTTANGVYVGTLVEIEVSPGRPWRGWVKITGVIDVAMPFEAGRRHQRRGLRIGDKINVGHSSIEPTELEGTTYLEALRRKLRQFQGYADGPRPGSWVRPSIEELKKRIAEEESNKSPD